MADDNAPSSAPHNKVSDLPVRLASAAVMAAIAGTALWQGAWIWAAFVAIVSLGLLWEWSRLVLAITDEALSRAVWLAGGMLYVGLAGYALIVLENTQGSEALWVLIGAVVATDVGAYFAGRAIGGRKIAPSISPSKTWAGLAGGAFLTICFLLLVIFLTPGDEGDKLVLYTFAYIWGPLIAILAQAGDFFESWMKRKAGVKDSSKLIPGHGGLFDRVDGLMAICFVIGIIGLVTGSVRP